MKRPTEKEQGACWDAYWKAKATGGDCVKERNALFDAYYLFLAWVCAKHVSGWHTFEEVLSHGSLGLLDAIERFDPKKSGEFRSYARIRIRGAVVDGVRSDHPLGPWHARMATRLKRAQGAIVADGGNEEDEGAIAKHLGATVDDAKDLLRAKRVANPLPLPDFDASQWGGGWMPTVEDPCPFEAEEGGELWRHILGGLPKNERFVVDRYFRGSKILREIGSELGVTESRAAQILRSALRRCKERCDASGIEKAAA